MSYPPPYPANTPPEAVQRAARQAIPSNTTPPLSRIVGRRFILALMTCAKDFILSLNQLSWIRELEGGPLDAECVISTAWDLRGDLEQLLLKRARECIAGPVHHNPAVLALHSEAWPLGANIGFALTAKWCFDHQVDWILAEPDACPMRQGWFTAIRREYYGCGRPFMGHIEPQSLVHPCHVAGNACYPWDVWTAGTIRVLWQPFDLQLARDGIVQQGLAAGTPSIYQLWSTIPEANIPPSFPTVASLDVIPPKTLLFHRSKDGTLIARLREQRQLQR